MNSESDWIDNAESFGTTGNDEHTPDNLEELVEEIANLPDQNFEDLYGFKHDCRCAQDWLEGNTGMVSDCFTRMADDALQRCFKYKGEVADLTRQRDRLRSQVQELGGDPIV